MQIPTLTVGTSLRHGHVTVLPIFSPTITSATDYRLGHDAVAAGVVEIGEVGHGQIDGLEALNKGSDRVLFVDGDHVVGVRQNRVVTSSALIGGKRKLVLPVSCVEQRRWSDPENARSVTSMSSAVRRAARLSVTRSLVAERGRVADQSRIWSTIAAQQRELRVTSATCAMADSFAERAADLGAAASRLRYPACATGLAIGIGSDVVSIDVFDKPATCEAYWRRLVDGAVLDGLGRGRAGSVVESDIASVLEALRGASWSRVPAVGDGDELRAANDDIAAALLAFGGRLLHLGVAVGRALDSSPRAVRRDLPPTLSDRFRIVERIGAGGSKEVFRAVDLRGGGEVAIARMPWVDLATFDDEVAMLRSIDSEYVARVVDAIVDDDNDGYLVMEYCNGPSIAKLIERGPLPVDIAGPILLAYARGLRAVHDACVLHRDVKPDNAVVCATPFGHRLKLIDFGLSARSASMSTAISGPIKVGGTLPYMAREALRGQPLDARTDVFAFGVCCYRIVVGDVPLPPQRDESDWQYLQQLAHVDGYDLAKLPALPEPARDAIARMLDVHRDRRPFMPDVVAAFERAFGDRPIAIATPAPAAAPGRRLALTRTSRIAIPVAAPEHVIVAACDRAPVVVLEPGRETLVRAVGGDGAIRWSRRLDGRLVAGIRADLDGDGAREIYLAGPDRVVGLDADGSLRCSSRLSATATPSLIAIADPVAPRLAVDGRMIDPRTGNLAGALPHAYAGDGRHLVPTESHRGVAFNGHALQSFGGGNGTAAAIVNHDGAARFHVAHLEQTSRRVQLVIYGPGGGRVHAIVVADCQPATGDAAEIARLARAPLFGAEHAPLAVLDDRTAIVIAPLLGADRTIPSTLVAFALPDGRELWRRRLDADSARVVLGRIDRPSIYVGTGRELLAFDARTGEPSTPLSCPGMPVAVGDPFFTGATHVFTASSAGIDVWRGTPCRPGAMQWSGPRGDHWRTGTLRTDGTPFGPL